MQTSPLDISTTYLGLSLHSPLIPSASPLSEDLAGLQEMQRCGAGAVVLHSLFEAPYNKDAQPPERYFEEIANAKRHLKMPVIGSLNARSTEGWTNLSRQIEQAGADALELNVYHISLDPDMASEDIEKVYLEVVEEVVAEVDIPVAVKLPPHFTNLARMTKGLEQAGAKGLVLFNRFYQPDLDLATMAPDRSLNLSTSEENRLPRHSIALLYRQTHIDLAANTGISTGDDVLKMILSGASATQICSILMKCGIAWMETIEQELRDSMKEYKIESLKEVRGKVSTPVMTEPGEIEHREYYRALQGYSLIDVPTWIEEVPLNVGPGLIRP
jgi:dihydroorotate dehydrogenase (fumarate)